MAFVCALAAFAAAGAHAGERRLIWCASVYGTDGKDCATAGKDYAEDTWEKNASLLEEGAFTDLIVAVGRGNMSHYDSKILAHSSAVPKGVFPSCLAAARKHGLKVHAWRVCYRMHEDALAPETRELRDRFESEGRLVKTFNKSKGIDQWWLCPSDPRNQDFEIEAIVDLARHSGADGVHLDYIRQRSSECCCENCRARFLESAGASAGEISERNPRWRAWRTECTTRVVRAASRRIRAEMPAIRISAAVQKSNESYAQDWPTWLEKGYCDFVCVMDYTPDAERFRGFLRQHKAQAGKLRGSVYPGIGFSSGSGKWPDDGHDMDRFAAEVGVLREEGFDGFCLFDLSFGNNKTKRFLPEIGRFLREAR